MNRNIFMTIAALLVFGVCVPAAADTDLSLFGAWIDTDDVDTTFGGGLKFDFLIADSGWAIDLRGSYFPELGRDLEDFIEGDDQRLLEIDMLPLDVGFNYHFFADRNLYLGAGVTWAFLDSNLGNLDDEVGWYLALGYKSNEPGGGLAFFADAMYRMIEGRIADDEFEEFDVTMDGFGLNVGLAIRF